MKKVVALLAVVAFSFSNVACDKKAEAPAVEETAVETTEVTPAEEPVVTEETAPVEGAAVATPAEGEAAVATPAEVEEPAK